MTNDEIIAKGKEVIRIEAEAVSGLLNSINEDFAKAVQIIYNSKGRVVLTGKLIENSILMALVLRSENLIKTYKKRTVVNGASIEVSKGEIVGLLGPNGAGKTIEIMIESPVNCESSYHRTGCAAFSLTLYVIIFPSLR